MSARKDPLRLALLAGGCPEDVPLVIVVSSLAGPPDRLEMSRLLKIAILTSSADDSTFALRAARAIWRRRRP